MEFNLSNVSTKNGSNKKTATRKEYQVQVQE